MEKHWTKNGMTNLHDLTTDQLRQVLHLKERIEFLQGLLSSLRGGVAPTMKKKVGRAKKSEVVATKKRMHDGQPVNRAKKGSTKL